MLDRITPVVLTANEEANLPRTLAALSWAQEVILVDSYSTDSTEKVARSYPNVRFYQNHFEGHAAQWNFALAHTGLSSEWVLALDADYVLTPEFVEEVRSLKPDELVSGYRAKFSYCVLGHKMRGSLYPPSIVLFRRGEGHFVQDGHANRLVLSGVSQPLLARISHDDRKPLMTWFRAQFGYADMEARKLNRVSWRSLSWADRVRTFRVVAPLLILPYCLVLRGGLIDGRSGIYYAFQRLLAEVALSLKLLDGDLRE